jgi:glycosyltransferase involved in cell wall biosynthesis
MTQEIANSADHASRRSPHFDSGGLSAVQKAPPGDPLRVLVVAFHFPPIAAAGTHRTLNFVRQWAEAGNSVGVVTTGSYEGFRTEPDLLARVPSEVRVARAWHCDPFRLLARLRGVSHSTPSTASPSSNGAAGPRFQTTLDRVIDFVSRLADVPDRYASFIVPAFLRGVALAGSVRPQVVYSTAPPASSHLAALLLADVLGLPLVVDLRDPWAVNPFRDVPYASLRELDDVLEALVVRRARRVILNTTLAERDYVARYGDPAKFMTIPNGISPDLFALPRGTPAAGGTRIDLVHLGSIYGKRSPLPFVRALARWRREDRAAADRVVVTQIGPIEDGGALVREIANHDVAHAFRLESSVPYREAFLRSTTAHALLLLGVSGELPEVQVPAKLFEYIAAGRPILALAKRGGAIRATLDRAGADYLAADPDDEIEILAALETLTARLATPQASETIPAGAAFRYEKLAAEMLAVLRDAAGVTEHA